MAEEIDVGMKCIKYMLFVSNFMFVMIGFLLISIGSTIKAIYGDFEFFMETHYFSPSILAIVIGVIIFFVALFGCVGAFRESTCLINLFGVFLLILLAMELSAAIAAYVMRGQIESTIRGKMEESISDYTSNRYVRDAWDFTQRRLQCCGTDKYTDWNPFFPTSPQTTADSITTTATTGSPSSPSETPAPTNNAFDFFSGPSTCCRRRDVHDGQCVNKYVFRDGCLSVLTYIVSESALLLGCGALAVAFIQMLGIIFAWMLAKAIRRIKTQQLIERDQHRQRAYAQLSKGKEEFQTPVLYTPTSSEA